MAKAKKKESTLTLEEKLAQALVPESEQPYKVPKNWCWTYIASGFDVTSSKRVHKCDWLTEGIPFYRTRELVKLSESGFVDNELFISEKMFEDLKEAYGVPKIGDILISGVGTIGVPYVVEENKKFYFKDGNVIWFRNKGIFIAKYIFYLYKTLFMINQVYGMSAGTTVDTYTIVNAQSTILPLPPLAEQQRIVDRIENLFAKLDEAKEKLQEVLDSFETRKAAILHKAFTGELTANWREEHGVDSEWLVCEVRDVFEMQAGKNISASKISKKMDEKNLYPCFGGNGIRGYVEYFNREGNHPIIGRQGALCGNVNLASGKFYATEHAVVVSFKQKTDIVWAEHYLRFLNFNQYATSTAQPGLAVSNLMKVSINVPLYEEQIEIGKIIVETFTREERVKLIAEESLEQIETMKKAILARAFRGELGTNDENDESAVELLKRVL